MTVLEMMAPAPLGACSKATPGATAAPEIAPRGFTIRQRLTLIVFAVAIPMLLLSVSVVWQLAGRERETSRQAILYASRSILSAVDAQISTCTAVAQALATSPSLQVQDLAVFRGEAERAMTGLPGAWVSLADAHGQQVVNTLVPADAPLPRLAPTIEADERRAFETRQVQIPGIVIGPVARTPVVGVGVPVFRGGEPAWYLQVAVKADTFRDLLYDRRLPEGWLAAVVDRTGAFVARSLDHESWVGKPASAGWRAVMHEDGVAEVQTIEGRPVVNANSMSPLSGWAVEVASEESVLEARMWQTMAVAGLVSLAVCLASVLLAVWMAGRITAPIKVLGEPVAFGPHRCPRSTTPVPTTWTLNFIGTLAM